MTSPFNDSELIQIDQPDDLNDSGFDGPWNQDFESTTYLSTHISLSKTNLPFCHGKYNNRFQNCSNF